MASGAVFGAHVTKKNIFLSPPLMGLYILRFHMRTVSSSAGDNRLSLARMKAHRSRYEIAPLV
jgi:hypothetical protein